MDDLRSEIRAAFEREQAGRAPANAMRGQVVEAVVSRSRPSRNFQWVAVVAAALLGIAVVAGLMSTRLAHRASVPAATPNASPIAEYGPPPAGVNLLYARDPVHPTWLIGYDWTGNPRGTIKLDPAVGGVGMAPDGQEFSVGYGAKGGSGELLDRLGKPIPGTGAIPGKAGPIWADDNRRMCGVSFDLQTFEWTFVTVAPGEAVKSLGVIARETDGGGQTGIRIGACSVRNDQAILVRTTVSWPAEIWVVRVSDGKVLSHTTYSNSSSPLSNLVASRDVVYIAENSTKSTSQIGDGAPSTIIRRVSDKSVVARLDPSMAVLAFGGNDQSVLVTTSPWVGQQPIHLAIVDLRSGNVLWRYDGPETLGTYLAEEGGNLDQAVGPGFAIGLKVITGTEDPQSDVVIVRGNGTEARLSGRYNLVW
jgi:hypothetical protein